MFYLSDKGKETFKIEENLYWPRFPPFFSKKKRGKHACLCVCVCFQRMFYPPGRRHSRPDIPEPGVAQKNEVHTPLGLNTAGDYHFSMRMKFGAKKKKCGPFAYLGMRHPQGGGGHCTRQHLFFLDICTCQAFLHSPLPCYQPKLS